MSPLVALLALQSAPNDYVKDPAYAKPITVELTMTPLRKLVEAMATASGRPLRYGGAVADWKATVLVRALPVGRTMEALADTLGLVWKTEEGGVLRLDRPDGAAREEAAFLKEEVRLAAASEGRGAVRGALRTPRAEAGSAPVAEGRRTYVRFDPDLLATEIASGPPPSRLQPGPTNGSAFAKSAASWPSVPQAPGEAWLRPVPPAFPKSAWTSGEVSLADLLAAWHGSSGLPVVADAFRVPMKTKSVSPAGALESLQALAGAERLSLKFADGVVRMRHPAFWRLRVQEVPESSWATIERTPNPDLQGLSAFASRLTPAQAASFRSQEPPLSRTNVEALRTSYPALLLWSSLPNPARTALLAGRPVALAQASGSVNAYTFALREAPYYDAGDPREVLAMNPARVGIFGAPSPKALSLRLAGERSEGVSYVLPL